MGFTIPVVPNIDIPPIIPSFAFNVFFAVSSPLGTDISTSTPNPSGSISSTVSLIIFNGTGFIAEFPGSTGSPFLVTFPTPVPPKIFIFESFRKLTFEKISRPWVTSGSSPPSFITDARTLFSFFSNEFTLIVREFPEGSLIVTSGISCLPSSRRYISAAFVAAVAELPVV